MSESNVVNNQFLLRVGRFSNSRPSLCTKTLSFLSQTERDQPVNFQWAVHQRLREFRPEIPSCGRNLEDPFRSPPVLSRTRERRADGQNVANSCGNGPTTHNARVSILRHQAFRNSVARCISIGKRMNSDKRSFGARLCRAAVTTSNSLNRLTRNAVVGAIERSNGLSLQSFSGRCLRGQNQ